MKKEYKNDKITKTDEGYMVYCPECGRQRSYKQNCTALHSVRNNLVCKVCVHKGNKHYLYGKELPRHIIEKARLSNIGKKHTDTHKSKISIAMKSRYLLDESRKKTSIITKCAMHRPDVRRKHIEALHHSKWLKVRTDKGQLELLEKWNKLGFSFIPNYQIKTETDLFYIDGYDPVHNVVLEYDGKYHLKLGQQEKDIIRQNKIINILNPKKFWRYNVVNKKWINVIER